MSGDVSGQILRQASALVVLHLLYASRSASCTPQRRGVSRNLPAALLARIDAEDAAFERLQSIVDGDP